LRLYAWKADCRILPLSTLVEPPGSPTTLKPLCKYLYSSQMSFLTF